MKNGLEIDENRDKFYYKDDLCHREDGPALEFTNAYNCLCKCWYINGKCHRIDGPAIECDDGLKLWFLSDKEVGCQTNEEFLKYVKYKWMF